MQTAVELASERHNGELGVAHTSFERSARKEVVSSADTKSVCRRGKGVGTPSNMITCYVTGIVLALTPIFVGAKQRPLFFPQAFRDG